MMPVVRLKGKKRDNEAWVATSMAGTLIVQELFEQDGMFFRRNPELRTVCDTSLR